MKSTVFAGAASTACAVFSICAAIAARGQPSPEPDAPARGAEGKPGLREVAPHVRVDVKGRIVEFDGTVPIDAHDPQAPNVYLEVIACTIDTKEHEALVVTRALPSHVHAALLAIGLKEGQPGRWTWEGEKMTAHPPEGDKVIVELIHRDALGREIVDPAAAWVKNEQSKEALPEKAWVFAGSRMMDRGFGERYDADGTGTLIGLATFGAETVAWPDVFSPDADVAEPVWIADAAKTPVFDTPVIVRLRPAEAP